MSILSKIECDYLSFTKSERRIAEYLLDDKLDDVRKLTLSRLSHELALGEATIIRFCKKLGLQGFQELKYRIALERDKSAIDRGVQNSEIKKNLFEAIETTDSSVSEKAIEAVADFINNAAYVLFYGVGVSALSASLGETNLFRYGKRAHAITESHAQIIHASLADKTCLVVAMSVSGETKDLIEAVSLAKRNGARIVVITGTMNSTISKLADHVFASYGISNVFSGGTSSTALSQMYLLDLLVAGYARYHGKSILKYGERVGWSMRRIIGH